MCTIPPRLLQGSEMSGTDSAEGLDWRANWSRSIAHDRWILKALGWISPLTVLWMNGILGVFECIKIRTPSRGMLSNQTA